MSLSDLASLGSFVSGFAVLISLIFLYFQLRQLNQQVKQAETNQQGAIQQARSISRIDMLRDRAADPALREAYSLANERPDDMTPAQYLQYTNHAVIAFLLAEEHYYQRKQGLVSDVAYEQFLSNLKRATFAQPGNRALWRQRRAGFTDEFAAFVDKVIDETRPRVFDTQSSLARWKADAKSEIERTVASQERGIEKETASY
jgi:hypothetical protein